MPTSAIATATIIMRGTHDRPDNDAYTGAGKEGSESHGMRTLDSEWMVASDAIRMDRVGEELIQLCSLLLGRDCIILPYLYAHIS